MSVYNRFSILEGGKKGVFEGKSGKNMKNVYSKNNQI